MKDGNFKNQSFKKAILSSNIKVISKECFKNCDKLEEIILPIGVKRIEESAFENCSSLRKIIILGDLEYIGDYAFVETKIENITFPESLKYIGDYAFFCCLINEVYLPDSVEFIGESAFKDCGQIGNKIVLKFYEKKYFIEYCKNNLIKYEILTDRIFDYHIDEDGALTFNSDIVYIEKETFKNNQIITSINFDKDIIVINESAFENCKNLKSISLSGIITIDSRAFCNCSDLISCNFRGDVISIGDESFFNDSLIDVNFKNSIKKIGERAFAGNPLVFLKLPDDIEFIGQDAFFACQNKDNHILIESNSKIVENYCNQNNILYSKGRTIKLLNPLIKMKRYIKEVTFYTEVKKVYGSGYKRKVLLEDINLSFSSGDMVFIMGCSGSGKSTLLKSIFGITKQSKVYSELKIKNGKNEKVYHLKKGKSNFMKFLTYGPQFSLSNPNLKVKQEIKKKLELRNIYIKKEVYTKTIAKYNLENLLDKKISNLSGGEKKRLMMAVADLCNCYIYAMDEPDSGLDEPFASQLFLQLWEKSCEGCIVAVVSHHPKDFVKNDQVIKFEEVFNKLLVLAVDEKDIGRVAYFGETKDARDFFKLKENDKYSDIIKILENQEQSNYYINRWQQVMKKN
ncbi:leucine-rich repeat protein [Absiella sp. AM29-15]|uniref:leucine-rich repeat protein n=1 Tax=Absiella sp. AM29-15 TaxID=2292278 RepID=UPI001F2DDE33|nr:leucine-rich repeat protein [Absiella sp. AM29-15]